MSVFNCVCAYMCALSVHGWVFICTSMQKCSPADMNFLRMLCLCVRAVICMGVKVKLSDLKQRCDVLGEVRLLACYFSMGWMMVGMVEVQSGLQVSCRE